MSIDLRTRCYHGVVYPMDNCVSCLKEELTDAQAERDALHKAVQPFVRLLQGTFGRIPFERLSASDWHELAKADASINTARAAEKKEGGK